jgi:hypothetical protein
MGTTLALVDKTGLLDAHRDMPVTVFHGGKRQRKGPLSEFHPATGIAPIGRWCRFLSVHLLRLWVWPGINDRNR